MDILTVKMFFIQIYIFIKLSASYLTIKVLKILINNYLNHKFLKFSLYALIFFKFYNILGYIT